MSDLNRLTLGVVCCSLSMGILTDVLLRATPWGLNLFLWTAALVTSYWVLSRWSPRDSSPRSTAGLLACAVLFSAAAAWRDSIVLKTLDVMAIIILLILAGWRQQGGALLLGTITGYLRAGFTFIFDNCFGVLRGLHKAIDRKKLPEGHWTDQVGPLLIGLVIALPLIVVFSLLFSAADATFSQFAVDFLNPEKLIPHGTVILLGAWLGAGCLRALLHSAKPHTPPVNAERRAKGLGAVELGTVLTCLNALFACFIVIQLRYFFGGETQIEITPGLLRSEYARRGFFELVAVAAILLPLLLSADWLHRREQSKTFFRLSALLLVGLLLVIMASAMQRMWIYQDEFGLTELRLYVTVFMGWLAMVSLWFAVTVLRGHRERFAFGSLMAGLAAIALLHCANPDGLIVRVNAARAAGGAPLDVEYLTGLSADAVPALVRSLPYLTTIDQTRIQEHLSDRPIDSDWRAWSFSRHTAGRMLP